MFFVKFVGVIAAFFVLAFFIGVLLKRFATDDDEYFFSNALLLISVPCIVSMSITFPLLSSLAGWDFRQSLNYFLPVGIFFLWLPMVGYIFFSTFEIFFPLFYFTVHAIIVGVFCWFAKENYFINLSVSVLISNLLFVCAKYLDNVLHFFRLRQFDKWAYARKNFSRFLASTMDHNSILIKEAIENGDSPWHFERIFELGKSEGSPIISDESLNYWKGLTCDLIEPWSFHDLETIYKRCLVAISLILIVVAALISLLFPKYLIISVLSVMGVILAFITIQWSKSHERDQTKAFMDMPMGPHSLQ